MLFSDIFKRSFSVAADFGSTFGSTLFWTFSTISFALCFGVFVFISSLLSSPFSPLSFGAAFEVFGASSSASFST